MKVDLAPLSPEVERALAGALHELRFGSVEIVVHDGRVVQIVRTEKLRLESRGDPTKPA